VLQWRGAGVTFEIAPVLTSREMQAVVAPLLGEMEDNTPRGAEI